VRKTKMELEQERQSIQIQRIVEDAARIQSEMGWTTGVIARDQAGEECGFNSLLCTSVCGEGALARAAGSHDSEDFFEALDFVEEFTDGYALNEWNDLEGRTKQEVVNLLKEAAETAKQGIS